MSATDSVKRCYIVFFVRFVGNYFLQQAHAIPKERISFCRHDPNSHTKRLFFCEWRARSILPSQSCANEFFYWKSIAPFWSNLILMNQLNGFPLGSKHLLWIRKGNRKRLTPWLPQIPGTENSMINQWDTVTRNTWSRDNAMFLIPSRGQGRKKSSISDWFEKHLKGNSLLSYYFYNVIAADRLISQGFKTWLFHAQKVKSHLSL